MEYYGWTVRDVYKKGNVFIPTRGGIAILATVLLVFSLTTLFYKVVYGQKLEFENFIIITVIMTYAMFGILDDFIIIRNRWLMIAVPYFFSFPLLLIINSSIVYLPFFEEVNFAKWGISTPFGLLSLEFVFAMFVLPLYVLVVANLVNMHSGFNGLQIGLSSILLFFLILKSIIIGKTDNLFPFAVFAGSIFAFWFYNFPTAKVFEGNIGSFAIGSCIGVFIVVQGFYVSGFIMLIPHTINFLMYFYWRVQRLRDRKKNGVGNEREWYKTQKFGKIREDSTIEVPNPLTLKWFFPYYFRLTEIQAVLIMYGLTIVFCIASLFILY